MDLTAHDIRWILIRVFVLLISVAIHEFGTRSWRTSWEMTRHAAKAGDRDQDPRSGHLPTSRLIRRWLPLHRACPNPKPPTATAQRGVTPPVNRQQYA